MDTALLLQILLVGAALYFFQRLFHARPALPLPPGPTGWPIVGCLPLLGSTPHIALTDLAKKYGPVMYLKLGTVDLVVVSTPDAAKTFLKALDKNFAYRPGGAGPTYIAYNNQDMVFADVGPKWKLLRKLCSLHIFGHKSFADWTPVRRMEIDFVVRDILELSRSQTPVPILELISCALANMIGQRLISQRLFEKRGEESNDFKHMVVELMRLAGLFNIGDFIPSIEWMDLQGIQGQMTKLHDKFDGLITTMLKEHAATTADRAGNPDFFDIVMATNKEADGVELSVVNYKALLLNLFIAGTDTSSTTIEWSMAEILKHPEILKKAQEEIDGVVGKDRRLEESDISKLPYLQAICKETFRYHPVVPLNLPRMTHEACEAYGYHIPKGTRLFTNLWAIGRDPSIWDDPLEFKPERFLTEKGSRLDPQGNDFELIPFGAGRRICAGMRMGLVTVQYIVGTLVHSFDWRLEDGKKLDFEATFGLVLNKTHTLEGLATPRLNPSAYSDL